MLTGGARGTAVFTFGHDWYVTLQFGALNWGAGDISYLTLAAGAGMVECLPINKRLPFESTAIAAEWTAFV